MGGLVGAHSTRPLGQVSNGSQRVGAQDEPTVEGPILSPGRETEAHTAPHRRRACARSWSGTTWLPPARPSAPSSWGEKRTYLSFFSTQNVFTLAAG